MRALERKCCLVSGGVSWRWSAAGLMEDGGCHFSISKPDQGYPSLRNSEELKGGKRTIFLMWEGKEEV